ncbi:hypothetical protein [Paenibacillus sp. P32E]|uniref:hypothetical protein n=1 Tax=Paenibacillus sp. P32E TaxID=1349434 RepID=UPI00093A94CF|nr:hypothetical protein [Paenibacillus sp. P32E]OKP91347.1 hypothetical protein A3848_09575 [Paenibacillus sp. P32E]
MTHLTQQMLVEEIERIRGTYLTSNSELPSSLTKRCKKLEKRLILKEPSLSQLVDIKYDLIELEKNLVNRPGKNEDKTLQRGIWAIVVLGVFSILIANLTEDLSKLNQPFLYGVYQYLYFAFIALFGTFSYMFSKVLALKNDYESFNIRFLLVFLFPIVFISLVKIEGDTIVGFSKINSIIFAAGYSSEFIFAFFTKIVDTSKKVINAEEKVSVEKSEEKIQAE